jgi:hypothetical protein
MTDHGPLVPSLPTARPVCLAPTGGLVAGAVVWKAVGCGSGSGGPDPAGTATGRRHVLTVPALLGTGERIDWKERKA